MRPHARRRNVVIVALVVALIILLLVVQGLAGFYANFLWFHWNGLGSVWSQVTATKVVLAVVFVVIAWALLWVSLFVVDTVAPRAMFLAPDNELVRRYQATVGPYALIVRSAVSLVIALILGIGASGQWQHWILFENALPFGRLDPLFHRDVSFFIFRLPFLSFLVDWIFTALVVTFIVTVIAYFLNGAIQLRRSARVEPRAIAHLSLILALIVLERAWAYYYVDRYGLDLSSSGVVHGASYTDVHVRLAALTLLAVISLVAFVAFSVNIYERSLALPAIAFGLWVFLALVVGVIYPAIFQALRVTPAQSTLELPYIKDNIAATRYAMGIDNVDRHTFPANEDLTPAVLTQYQKTLSDVLLWDPSVAVPTFQRLQVIKSYYQLSTLAVDRYEIDGKTTPVVVGVRSLNPGGLAQQSWVNTHLQYTHGYGVVAAAANVANSSNLPNFLAGNIPTSSSSPALSLSRPAVYYAPGDSQYAIVDTKQPEVQYQAANGTNVEGHCHGCGGIPIGGFFNRLTFAIHLRDLNLLISNLVTGQSRLIYIPDIEARVQKALPFLQVDSHPYPVVVDGEIDWVVDAYTTSAYFPYGQPAADERAAVEERAGGQVRLRARRRQGRCQRLHRQDVLLCDRTVGSVDPGVRARLPRVVPAAEGHEPGATRAPALPAGPAHGPGRHVRSVPHRVALGLLQPVGRLGPLADLEFGVRIALEPARPLPERLDRPLHAGLRAPPAPRGQLTQLRRHRAPGALLVERQPPDVARALRRRFERQRLRQARRLRDAGRVHSRPGARQRRHQRQPDDLQGDHAPRQQGFDGVARHGADPADRGLAHLRATVVRVVVANPLPAARRRGRRLREGRLDGVDARRRPRRDLRFGAGEHGTAGEGNGCEELLVPGGTTGHRAGGFRLPGCPGRSRPG